MKTCNQTSNRPIIAPMFRPFFYHQPSMQKTETAVEKAFRPKTNVVDLEDATSILLAVPGFKKEDIAIKLEGDILKISATKPADTTKFLRQEFSTQAFERTFQLNDELSRDGIDAAMKDGILTITIKKMTKPVNIVEVK